MKRMKKGLLALALGFGLLVGNPSLSNAKDKEFYKVVSSLRKCAYASYKRQDSPTQENKSKENYTCSKFDDLKRSKGISSLEDYFKENGPGRYGWFYVYSIGTTHGKQNYSYYAARITNKFEREGFPVYFTRLGKGVDSFKGFMYNMKYLGTINNGANPKIIIDLERIEKDAIKVEKSWKNYFPNHKALLRGDLINGDPKFESVYLSLLKYDNIKKGYMNEKVNSIIAHELEHAKGAHRHDDINGEEIALSAEINNSPIGLYFIHENASKGDPAETAVLKCLMNTRDIFNKRKQANFYLKGKKYIQRRAAYCKKKFLRER